MKPNYDLDLAKLNDCIKETQFGISATEKEICIYHDLAPELSMQLKIFDNITDAIIWILQKTYKAGETRVQSDIKKALGIIPN